MKKLILISILFLSLSCKQNTELSYPLLPNDVKSNIRLGEEWIKVKQLLEKFGWKFNSGVMFQLEKSFVDKGGKIYPFIHPSNNELYFITYPLNKIETLSAIQLPNNQAMGGELQIIEILAK